MSPQRAAFNRFIRLWARAARIAGGLPEEQHYEMAERAALAEPKS
jgi:hypothetical protein